MALTKASVWLEQYQANAGYDIEGSVAKCKLFIVAARALVTQPKRLKTGRNAELEHDPARIEAALIKAERWYASRGGESGTDSGVGYYGLSEARR